MIDWGLTGSVDLSSYRPKVIVKCDGCGVTSSYTIRVKSKVNDGQVPWLCCKCVGNKEEVRKNHSDKQKEIWKREDYRKEREKSSTELWKNEEYRTKHALGVSTEEARQKSSNGAILAWRNEEYRKAHANAMQKQLLVVPNTEKKVISILDDLGVKYKHQFALGIYSFDFCLERVCGKPFILLEINGNYWHTRANVVRKDRAKASYVSNYPDYELKTIWEHQLYDGDRVVSLIKRWVGLDNVVEHFSLDDLVVKLVNREDLVDLVSNYHYLGCLGRGGIYVGGFIGDKLICGAVFAHPIRKEVYAGRCSSNEALELSRLVKVSSAHNENWGSFFLGKALKMLPSEIQWVFAFSDSGEGHYGTIYKASNFEFEGGSVPSYFYLDDNGGKYHKKTIYGQATRAHLKEREFVEKFNLKIVHTPPTLKYSYRRR